MNPGPKRRKRSPKPKFTSFSGPCNNEHFRNKSKTSGHKSKFQNRWLAEPEIREEYRDIEGPNEEAEETLLISQTESEDQGKGNFDMARWNRGGEMGMRGHKELRDSDLVFYNQVLKEIDRPDFGKSRNKNNQNSRGEMSNQGSGRRDLETPGKDKKGSQESRDSRRNFKKKIRGRKKNKEGSRSMKEKKGGSKADKAKETPERKTRIWAVTVTGKKQFYDIKIDSPPAQKKKRKKKRKKQSRGAQKSISNLKKLDFKKIKAGKQEKKKKKKKEIRNHAHSRNGSMKYDFRKKKLRTLNIPISKTFSLHSSPKHSKHSKPRPTGLDMRPFPQSKTNLSIISKNKTKQTNFSLKDHLSQKSNRTWDQNSFKQTNQLEKLQTSSKTNRFQNIESQKKYLDWKPESSNISEMMAPKRGEEPPLKSLRSEGVRGKTGYLEDSNLLDDDPVYTHGNMEPYGQKIQMLKCVKGVNKMTLPLPLQRKVSKIRSFKSLQNSNQTTFRGLQIHGKIQANTNRKSIGEY